MTSETFLLARAIGEEGERWFQCKWNRSAIERQLLCEIAVAVQRGNALTMLSGHTKVVRARAMRGQRGNMGCEDGGAMRMMANRRLADGACRLLFTRAGHCSGVCLNGCRIRRLIDSVLVCKYCWRMWWYRIR
jgi:hypothetical protein